MNIFVLDKNPCEVPKMLCDLHLNKMLIEALQLLSTEERLRGNTNEHLYKITHQNHPCRLCLSNFDNYLWLVRYVVASIQEWEYRFDKIHGCNTIYESCFKWLLSTPNDYMETNLSFPKCMPDEFKVGDSDINSIVESYQNYYRYKKTIISRWKYTKREEPEWLNDIN